MDLSSVVIRFIVHKNCFFSLGLSLHRFTLTRFLICKGNCHHHSDFIVMFMQQSWLIKCSSRSHHHYHYDIITNLKALFLIWSHCNRLLSLYCTWLDLCYLRVKAISPLQRALALENQLVDGNISVGIKANTGGFKAIASVVSIDFLPQLQFVPQDKCVLVTCICMFSPPDWGNSRTVRFGLPRRWRWPTTARGLVENLHISHIWRFTCWKQTN